MCLYWATVTVKKIYVAKKNCSVDVLLTFVVWHFLKAVLRQYGVLHGPEVLSPSGYHILSSVYLNLKILTIPLIHLNTVVVVKLSLS